jgi:hypothetical protein
MCAAVIGLGCAQAAEQDSDDDGHRTQVAGSGGGGGTTAATTTSTGGASPMDCDAPSGTPGVHAGEIVGALEWQGYAGTDAKPSTIAAYDYYDCDGTRGIHALVITQSALWCGPCQADAGTMETKLNAEWSALGIRALTLMVEHNTDQPATIATAETWKQSLGLTKVDVATDAIYSFDAFDFDKHIPHSGFPVHLVVDPRTMQIIMRSDTTPTGALPIAEIEQLAQQNKP